MKKEYKTPEIDILNADVEWPMMIGSTDQDYDHIDSKKSGRIYEDEEIAPAAPKKFWDDEN